MFVLAIFLAGMAPNLSADYRGEFMTTEKNKSTWGGSRGGGRPKAEDPTESISVSIKGSTLRRVRTAAKTRELSVSAFINQAIEKEL